MSEFYESENSCVRCLRSSPIASLLGFIVVLIGGGAFGGATIFARRYLIALLDAPHLFPYLDYAVYGLVGAIGLFSLLAYLLCALSSGWNAKHCFESSRKSACGRCCNMTLLVLLVMAILIWSALACLMSYPVVSIAFLWYRNEGATRLRLASMDLPGLVRQTRAVPEHSLAVAPANSAFAFFKQPQQPSDLADYTVPRDPGNTLDTSSYYDENPSDTLSSWSQAATESRDLENSALEPNMNNYDDSPPGQVAAETLDNVADRSQAIGKELTHNLTDLFRSTLDELKPQATAEVKDYGQRLLNKALSATEAVAMFFKCSSDSIDLSYYGLYDEQGLPIYVARNNFENRSQNVLICVCIAIGGLFFLILGYLQIIICTAMNYARLQESRYYEASSEVGEEGVALQQ